MARLKKIVVLLHEKDRYPKSTGHFIWGLCRVWREQGIRVQVIKGTRKKVDADILIPHIDATVLPPAYTEFLERYPCAVNRGLNDISKRLISRNIVTRADGYDGPVIVKTNLNCGGGPDVNFTGVKVFFSAKPTLAWLNKKKSSSDWQKINCMECEDYPVFSSLKEVPEAVFNNPWLVVERFLPERQNGIYYLRVYQFCGDQGYCARWGSPHPIVKRRNIVSREEVEIPEEVMAVRRELGMDYGKLDFVIHAGQSIVFDANRTPGLILPESRMRQKALQLAPGIHSLF